MGCTMSATIATLQHNKNGDDGCTSASFTALQKRIVLRNWKVLSNDLNGRGARIFLRIFDRNPSIKALFSCSKLRHEDLMKDATFKGHASRFMQAVGAVIDNIDDYESALSPLLNGLGRQHIHYRGFKYSYFDTFEEAMIHVWSEDLGGKFDDNASEAWHRVFGFIMDELKGGYQDALGDAGLTRPAWEEEEIENAKNLQPSIETIAINEDAENGELHPQS